MWIMIRSISLTFSETILELNIIDAVIKSVWWKGNENKTLS